MNVKLTHSNQSSNAFPTQPANRKLIPLTLLIAIIVMTLLASITAATAQVPAPNGLNAAQTAIGTAFTYQGRLTDGGHPANGLYDFQFTLFDALSGGNPVGGAITKEDVSVANGVFTVELDFGSAFNGGERYLEMGVRPGSSTGAYTPLAPRRALTAAPYALYAASTGALQGYAITTTAPMSGQVLKWNGDEWGPAADETCVGSNELKDFEEYALIPTHAATDWESFVIGSDTYLAVANAYNGSTWNIDSKIYRWNGAVFTETQSIPTNGATDWEFFAIGSDIYLAVANDYNDSTHNINSKIYKWNGTSFTEIQSIPTSGARAWKFFTVGSDAYLAVANYYNDSTFSTNSKIYKWNGTSFAEFQSIPTNGAIDWEFFTIGSDAYLAVANNRDGSTYNISSKIYRWNGTAFTETQSILTNGAMDWEFFIIGSDAYLALANASDDSTYNINSKLYRWNGASFVEFQSIPTNAAYHWEFFTIGSNAYLALANYYNGSTNNIDSKLYRWNGTGIAEVQSILTNGAYDWEFFTLGSDVYLAVANTRDGSTYNINSKIYKAVLNAGAACPGATNSPPFFYYPASQPMTLDLAAVAPSLAGFSGGFTDGHYGYFVPDYDGVAYSGKVARVDLRDFSAATVTTLDLTLVDPDLTGFWGGFTDGYYGYFVPHGNTTFSGKVARVDLQNFATSGVTVLDLTLVDPALKGFVGGFTDGRYGYFVPSRSDVYAYSGKVARVDLQNFGTSGVTVLDLSLVDPDLKGFSGGFTDGRYGYFVPFETAWNVTSGKVARVDLQNFATGTVTVLDLTTVDPDLKGFWGGFTDGRYGYIVPYAISQAEFSGKAVRVDLQNFTISGVTALDLSAVDAGLKGFFGGFTDGRYGYFVPQANAAGTFSGKAARVDLQNFAADGITVFNLDATDPSLKGFSGGFSDGRYGYFVPYRTTGAVYFGKVARIQLYLGGGLLDGTNSVAYAPANHTHSGLWGKNNLDVYYNQGNVGIGIATPQSALQVGGYVQLDTLTAAPPAADCDEASERGRMKIDIVNNWLYICTNSGWVAK